MLHLNMQAILRFSEREILPAEVRDFYYTEQNFSEQCLANNSEWYLLWAFNIFRVSVYSKIGTCFVSVNLEAIYWAQLKGSIMLSKLLYFFKKSDLIHVTFLRLYYYHQYFFSSVISGINNTFRKYCWHPAVTEDMTADLYFYDYVSH